LTNIGLAHFFAKDEFQEYFKGFETVDPCLTTYYLPASEAKKRGYDQYQQAMWGSCMPSNSPDSTALPAVDLRCPNVKPSLTIPANQEPRTTELVQCTDCGLVVEVI
jgi:hypothetical protein